MKSRSGCVEAPLKPRYAYISSKPLPFIYLFIYFITLTIT